MNRPIVLRQSRLFAFVSVFCLLLGLSGCSDKETVVARVGDIELTHADFLHFVDNIPGASPDGQLDYLQSMVNRELLLLEAAALRLHEEPEVAGELAFLARRRLAEIYQTRVISPRVEITEKDLQQEFVESQLNKERLLSRILVRTDEDRDKVLSQLRAGRPFGELIGPFAPNDAIAEGDGLVGWFNHPEAQRRFRIPPRVFFSLPQGQVAEPVRLSRGWQIFRFTEERTPPFEDYYEEVVRLVRKKQWKARNREELELLQRKSAARLHPDGLQQLLDRLQGRPLKALGWTPDFNGQALYSFDGGALSLEQAVPLLRHYGLAGPLPDSSAAIEMFGETLLRPLLFAREARGRGWDQEAEFSDWYAHQKKKVLLTQLMNKKTRVQGELDGEAVKVYYGANKERFKTIPQVKIRQLTAATPALAEDFRRQMEEGTPIGQLLVRRDAETYGKPRSGELTLNSVLKARYPKLVEAAFALGEGEWAGPIEVEPGHYAVFQVLQHMEAHHESFAEARGRVEALLKKQRENEQVAQFITGLREKYADRVVVYPDRLMQSEGT
ncbi:MAG: hypothetical protein GKR89_18825 [Candidatus Latescibacteria bacterium]|nr:hypothetical protein [Candidatus Latescibacterota bacterium]